MCNKHLGSKLHLVLFNSHLWTYQVFLLLIKYYYHLSSIVLLELDIDVKFTKTAGMD